MSDSIKSRAQLIEQVAVTIGVLGDGQTLASSASATIDNYIGPVLLSLATRGVVDVSNVDSTPGEYFIELACCVGDAAGVAFGIPLDPAKVEYYEDRLRLMTRRSPAPIDHLTFDPLLRRTTWYGGTLTDWQAGE